MGIDISTTDNVANVCASTKTDECHRVLLQKLANIYPGLNFKHVLTRTGWHRTGGIVDEHGNRIAENLRQWIEHEYQGDIESLIVKYTESNLIATSLIGKAHYFVAQTGDEAQSYIQIEVEELREFEDHFLFSPEYHPDNIEDIVDPIQVDKLDANPVGDAYYLLRRITHVDDFMQTLSESLEKSGKKYSSIIRFMQDWDRSSAIESGPFCHYWVLSFQEYTDAWGERILQAKPVHTSIENLPIMKLNAKHRGSELARLIHGFDHDVGYPMAWYFFMLSHKEVPHQLAEAIHKDMMGAYDYLPVRDLKVLKDWSKQPYGI